MPSSGRNRHRAETVAGHIVGDALRATTGETVARIRERLLSEKPASVELILVVGDDHSLVGVLPIASLFSLDGAATLAAVMERGFPSVLPTDDQEHAASVALHHGVDALPVVDADGRPLGIMPSQALLQVLRREHVEDLHLLAGIQRESTRARHAIEDPPLRRVRHRLPWLLAGFVGSMIATGAMAGFESTLNQHIAVAFFVPAIVYLADAIGTQSEAIAVRGLSLTRSGIGHLLAGELRTGMLLGTVLGLLSFPLIWAAFGNIRLAAAVASALFAAGSMAATVGLLLPWLLARWRRDPAYGSGPLATIVQDVLSLLVYLGVVRAFGL